MPIDLEAQMKQDMLIEKLKWLNGRAKPDFQGNLNPHPRNKTATSVQHQKQKENRLRTSPDEFKPFSRNHRVNYPNNLRMDATKLLLHRSDSCGKEEEETMMRKKQQEVVLSSLHPNRNEYKQELDPNTGRPVVATLLHWHHEAHPTPETSYHFGRRAFPEKSRSAKNILGQPPIHLAGTTTSSDGCDEVYPRLVTQDLANASPGQKVEFLRAEMLLHPKFTAKTKLDHAGKYWDPMSQLLSHAFLGDAETKNQTMKKEKEKKQEEEGHNRKNPIRMVALMRRNNSAKAWR